MKAKTYKWKIVSTEETYALECQNCKHKMPIKKAIIANIQTDICPFCNAKMDMSDFDYDELFSLASGEADVQ